MKQELEAIRAKALEAIGGAEKAEDLEALRVQYLGKKGELTAVLKQMGSLSAEERPVIGQLANEVRAKLEESVETRAKELAAKALEMKLKRLLPRCRRNEGTIALDTDKNKVFIRPDELLYVEIFDHHIHYQTAGGVLRSYGTLKMVEEQLPKNIFFRVNNQTIINLHHVTRMDAENVYLGEREFPISMRRRKGFIEALHLSKTGR